MPSPTMPSTPSLTIRPASGTDGAAISALIMSLAHSFTVHPDGEGAQHFFSSVAPGAIEQLIAADNVRYFCARIAEACIGVVAVRDGTHILHLFVAAECQRQGVATQLWAFIENGVLAQGSQHRLTVNSTLGAVDWYARRGFTPCGVTTQMHGIAFIPMHRLA